MELLNVTMHSASDFYEIQNEIYSEFYGVEANFIDNNGFESEKRYVELKEQFKKFDLISDELTLFGKHTNYRLIQKGTRFGIFFLDHVIINPNYLQICPYYQEFEYNTSYLGGETCTYFLALDDTTKWGIIKSLSNGWVHKTELFIDFKYDDILPPHNGFYPIKVGKYWGLWYQNHNIIRPQYQDASTVSEGLWVVKKGGEWGCVNIFNKTIIPFNNCGSISDFKNGKTKIFGHFNIEYDPYDGFDLEIDLNENIRSRRNELKRKKIESANNKELSLFQTGSKKESNVRKCKEKGFEGVIIPYNNEPCPIDVPPSNRAFDGVKIMVDKEDQTKFSSSKETYYAVQYYYDNIVIPKGKYKYLGEYNEGLFQASLDGNKYGYVDINDNVIIPFIYKLHFGSSRTVVSEFHNGMACVLKGEIYDEEINELRNYQTSSYVWEIIDHNNKKLFPEIKDFCELGHARNGFILSLDDIRYKRSSLTVLDVINYQKSGDLDYLIRNLDEIKEEIKRRNKIAFQGPGYEWTMEDTWDAMTDGMYGDYEGGDIDFDKLGY